METQPRYFSTKKKKLCSDSRLCRPSVKESQKIIESLTEKEPKFCGCCLQEDDTNYRPSALGGAIRGMGFVSAILVYMCLIV